MSQANALIVDTSTSMRNYVRGILQQELGFNEIYEAQDADAAHLILKSGRIMNWIFSAWEMPSLSSRDLLRIVRNGPNRLHTRFVLMSASHEFIPRKIALREGAADFLHKPFVPDQLTSIVHRLNGLAEHRGNKRFDAALPCEVNIGFDSFHDYGAELTDISITGCRMKTSKIKPGSGYINDYTTLTLPYTNELPIHVHAKIKRVEFHPSCTNPLRNTEIAIEFIDITPALKENLEAYICKAAAN